MSQNSFSISGREIGPDQPCYVIAEAGVNHNGDLELAKRLIDAAVEAGADAVKFQTFAAARLVTPDAAQAEYQAHNTGIEETQQEMLERLELNRQQHVELIAHCDARGIQFLSSPFDEEAADLLESLDVPAFKIPSGELTNHPYLAHIASKNLPMIVSSGMASEQEIGAALGAIRAAGDPPLVLLQCTTNYPAAPETVNLRAMATLADHFELPVGFSDHTEGIAIPLAAVALGAVIVEKHFTLDRSMPGPDHKASLEPDELKELVDGIRRVEAALGSGVKQPADVEREIAKVIRKGLVLTTDLKQGEVLSQEHLVARRPAEGLPPSALPEVVGKTLTRDKAAGEPLREDDLS